MASREQHWVEELFPPVYNLSLDDLLTEEEDDKQASVYELAARRISKFDPDTIKNVFERVWLMKTLEEKQRTKEDTSDEKALDLQGKHKSDIKVPVGQDSASSSNLEKSDLETIIHDVFREGPARAESDEVDISASKLWTSNEIKDIRKVYNSARKENIKLKAALQEAESRVKAVEKQKSKQFTKLTGNEETLAETQKANKRLQILSSTLKNDLDRLEKENEELEEQIEELRGRNGEMVRDMSDMTKVVETERIQRQNAQIDLEGIRKVEQRRADLQVERIDLKYQKQIEQLVQELEEARAELEKERKDHQRTKKGLEHLQTHFASVPYKDSESRRKMVTTNQLTSWTS